MAAHIMNSADIAVRSRLAARLQEVMAVYPEVSLARLIVNCAVKRYKTSEPTYAVTANLTDEMLLEYFDSLLESKPLVRVTL
jgi:hypothetical protein